MFVQREFAPAKIIVVECWKIIVHKAEAVHKLERHGSRERTRAIASNGNSAVPRKERAQALAAASCGVMHRGCELGR
jgi:hypothetical protein